MKGLMSNAEAVHHRPAFQILHHLRLPGAAGSWLRFTSATGERDGMSDRWHAPDTIAQVVTAWARSEPLIRRIYLFGSRARGDQLPRSDIDLAVLNGIDPEEMATCVRSALPCSQSNTAELAASARDWTYGANRDRWHLELTGFFDVPVHLERPRNSDLRVRPSLKQRRALLYRACGVHR